jgi:hypothetical protein
MKPPGSQASVALFKEPVILSGETAHLPRQVWELRYFDEFAMDGIAFVMLLGEDWARVARSV